MNREALEAIEDRLRKTGAQVDAAVGFLIRLAALFADHETGEIEDSQRSLADNLGMDRATVARRIETLQRAGLIRADGSRLLITCFSELQGRLADETGGGILQPPLAASCSHPPGETRPIEVEKVVVAPDLLLFAETVGQHLGVDPEEVVGERQWPELQAAIQARRAAGLTDDDIKAEIVKWKPPKDGFGSACALIAARLSVRQQRGAGSRPGLPSNCISAAEEHPETEPRLADW